VRNPLAENANSAPLFLADAAEFLAAAHDPRWQPDEIESASMCKRESRCQSRQKSRQPLVNWRASI